MAMGRVNIRFSLSVFVAENGIGRFMDGYGNIFYETGLV